MASHTDTIRTGLEIVARETSRNADRLPRALDVLTDSTAGIAAHAPDQTGSGAPPSGAVSDPTYQAHSRRDTAREDRRRIEQYTRDLLDASRRLTVLVDRYNPTERLQAELRGVSGVTNDDIWCPNHLTHGHHETRREGRTYCRWCEQVQRDHKKLPTAALIDAKSRRTLSEADYRRLLKTR